MNIEFEQTALQTQCASYRETAALGTFSLPPKFLPFPTFSTLLQSTGLATLYPPRSINLIGELSGYMPVRRVCVRLSNVNDASSINSHLDKKQIHFQKANNQHTDRPSKKNRLIREGIQTGEPGEQSPVSIWLNTPTVLRSGSLWLFTSAVVIHTKLHYEVRW